MNISLPFIHRPVMTTLVMLALTAFGAMAYHLLPVSSLPSIEYPTIQVSTTYPGASPDEMARLVSGPLERQFMLMQGINLVSTSNTYQTSTIICQFHMDVNIDIAGSNVMEAINQALAQMPTDLPQNPAYTKANPSDTPILYLGIHSTTVDAATLYDYGYNLIGQQLGTIQGVGNIDVFGFPYAVRIRLDPQAVAAKGITLDHIANALNDENPDQPTGKFYGPYRSVPTITEGQIYEAEKYNNLILKYDNGAPVRLRDIGYARPSVENDKQVIKWVTKETLEPVVFLAIYKEIGYNTKEICDNITTLTDRLKVELPDSIELIIPYNQAWWIDEAILDVQVTLAVAFLLVVLVIFFYLGKVRNSLIPLITLPITITGSLLFMLLFGYSIDILSLSAVTLAIGFLVDDAIVVLENIVRWIQGGEEPFQASVHGSKQISTTILSISLCLAAVFVPMFLLSGMIGQIFREFSAVIMITVLFSGFISLTLTPMLCSRFLSPYAQEDHPPLERFSIKLNALLLTCYKPLLRFFLKHRLVTLGIATASVIGSILLFTTLPRTFLPPNDLGIVQGLVEADEGTSPRAMDAILTELTELAIQNPYVESIARITSNPTDNQSLFFINLIPRQERPDIWSIIETLRKDLNHKMVGVDIFMKSYPLINLQVGSVAQGKSNFQYTLQALDQDDLFAKAAPFLDALKNLPELTQVSSDMETASPSLNVALRRDQAHAYQGLNAKLIENAFKYAYGETYISRINMPQNMYYVILELMPEYLSDPSQLTKLYLGNKNAGVAIDSVIDITHSVTPQMVNHINAIPSVTISFNIQEGVPLSEAISALEQTANDYLPQTIIRELAGNTAAFEQMAEQLALLILLALFIIYLILGILYENFLHPITALSAIPVAAFGGLLTLVLMGESLSIYAFIGLIMLLGIVMKNSIIIIDFALEEMEKGASAFDAAFNACCIRFRPILMTTLAAMMGSVPIALGIGGTVAEGRAPLGMVVIGGLLFSQAVTLLVTPVVFIYLARFQAYITTRTTLFRSIKARAANEHTD